MNFFNSLKFVIPPLKFVTARFFNPVKSEHRERNISQK